MALVLVVEDEAAMLEVFAEVVESLGHETLRASDGEAALMLARAHRPSLVVSDHMMPRRTGIELLRAIRAEPQLADVPFVLLSAARPADHTLATKFLQKPVDLKHLEEAVRRSLADAPATTREAAPAADARGPPDGRDDGRRELLNWVAHEIKTPLAAARAQSQMLQRRIGTGTPEQLHRSAAAIIRQLDRMNALLESILDASRLEDGKLALTPRRHDLAAFLRSACDEWREAHPAVEFQLAGADTALVLSFDPDRLRQVLDNLVSNAVKYGGTRPRTEVTLSTTPGLALVEIRDHGVGIAASELPHVFERFKRGGGGGPDGHGLGLFIASALATLHGGALSAKSSLGEGTAFTLRLPLAS